MPRPLALAPLIAALFLPACAAADPPAAPAPAEPVAREVVRSTVGPTRHALLVACSTYPALAPQYHLQGPPQDVRLLAEQLTKKFQIAPANITKLLEGEPAAMLPQRANILREFDRLAQVAARGDQIVILLGGHGTQQPDNNPGSRDDSEPDGMDEVFLPSDFESRYDAANKTIVGAITDDEIGQKLQAIRQKGAFVWIIFDCCHSGTMTRGTDVETPRHISPKEAGIPAGVLAAVTPAAPADGARGGPDPEETPIEASAAATGTLGGLAAIYAALPTEKTFDDSFPKGVPASQQVRHGILTYAICQILERASEPLTYTELVERVRQQYVQWRRPGGPTPLVDGPDREKEIFGEQQWPGRSAMKLKVAGGKMTVNAGGLQGLSPGAILAVMPPAGEGSEPAGYVQRRKLQRAGGDRQAARARREAGNSQARHGSRRSRSYGSITAFASSAWPKIRRLRATQPVRGIPLGLATRCRQPDSASRDIVQVVADPQQADWIVRVDGSKSFLVPASGWTGGGDAEARSIGVPDKQFGPYSVDDGLGRQLGETFAAISRAQNLLALSEPADGERLSSSLRVDLKLTRHQNADDAGKPLDLSRGKMSLAADELVGFSITNRGRKPVDVTLLFVDSGFGITAWYPKDGEFNRLDTNETIGPPDINFARISDKTTGLEHMVLIAAAPAGDAPLDFTWLAQPTLAAARAVPGLDRSAFDSPLSQLLENAAYSPGSTRSAEAVQVQQSCIRTVSWKVEEPAAMK